MSRCFQRTNSALSLAQMQMSTDSVPDRTCPSTEHSSRAPCPTAPPPQPSDASAREATAASTRRIPPSQAQSAETENGGLTEAVAGERRRGETATTCAALSARAHLRECRRRLRDAHCQPFHPCPRNHHPCEARRARWIVRVELCRTAGASRRRGVIERPGAESDNERYLGAGRPHRCQCRAVAAGRRG